MYIDFGTHLSQDQQKAITIALELSGIRGQIKFTRTPNKGKKGLRHEHSLPLFSIAKAMDLTNEQAQYIVYLILQDIFFKKYAP